MEYPDVVAMIPARMGSTRLKMKNLALVNKKPLVSHVIEAAQEASVFDRIVVNADHGIFSEIAKQHNVEFYLRPLAFGSSTTKSDDVVADFMKKHIARIVAWVNPTSPLQTGSEIRDVVRFFQKEQLDSLITVKDERVHCTWKGNPVNFNPTSQFAQTQDLIPVQRFVYSVMMWKSSIFLESYQRNGYAFFCGKTGYFPVSNLSAVIIKTDQDLMLADFLMRTMERRSGYQVSYDPLVEKIHVESG
jgi:CMP-N-acetylneuraminic acid synthetase